ncbi:MAG: hypothetical protein KVP17_005110 [Porospora cf. gigantea B]|nr:MAG: hypothetical protein KVP17_005110 [Porospora cf. gigantea B]
MRHPWFKHMGLTGAPLPELTQLVKENLLGVAEMSQLKILLMNLMAHHLSANDKQVHQLHLLFSAVNRNFNGEISQAEFCQWLTAGGVADDVATRVFSGLDIRAGGRLSLTEFLAGTFEFAREHLAGLKGAFNRMDFDNDNGINLDEFNLLLSGGREAGGRLSQYFCRLGGTEDGLLRWSDLESYLTGKEGIFR